MRKEGGKYAHLNEDLHLLVEVYSEISDCYGRLSHALGEVQKFLTPEYNDEIAQEQMQQMAFMNGDKPQAGPPTRGRGGAARGGAPSHGGRGGALLGGPPPPSPGVGAAPRYGAPGYVL